MLSRHFSSQQGFSLIRFVILLLTLLGFAVLVLAILPRFMPNSGIVDMFNSLSQRAQNLMSGVTQKISAIGQSISAPIDKLKARIVRKLEDLGDWWCRKVTKKCPEPPPPVIQGGRKIRTPTQWEDDMAALITYAEEYGYNMQAVRLLWDRYLEGTTSARRVEAEYWDQIQQQTENAINTNIERFRTRPLGCSDFTDELINIWEIEQQYNSETLEGYIDARLMSEQLHDPRSLEFAREIFGWLGYQDSQWFMEQLTQAIPIPEQTTDYPKIIESIDARIQNATNPFECVLGNITVAEIYLNYDLIDPAQNRFDQSIRDLAGLFTRYGSSIPADKLVGLHMGMGLLNERVCRNNDLAIKEFKDAVAAARRINLKCEYYNLAHYNLGVINLKLRDAKVQPEYISGGSDYAGTADDLYQATPTPAPTPIPTPTPRPNPIKINIEIPIEIFQARSLKTTQMGTGTSRALTPSGVTKGDITLLRDIRLRPRTELGETQKMKTFSIDQLYDLSRIPDSAIREFESYLQCSGDPLRVRVARYIHDRYMGK